MPVEKCALTLVGAFLFWAYITRPGSAQGVLFLPAFAALLPAIQEESVHTPEKEHSYGSAEEKTAQPGVAVLPYRINDVL